MRRCPICGGRMEQTGSVMFTNPVTKRKRQRNVMMCQNKKCGHRVVK